MDMQFFQEKIKKLWNGCQIRVLVSVSLSLQIIVILFGSRRKYIAKGWIKILVWLAYLAADWVATVALGNLATSQGDSGDNYQKLSHELQAFWAPFLLWHLGGPDTITAYSLEDNDLWLRHLLGFVVQLGVAINVFVQSWSQNAITFIAIPVLISGVTKYAERTFVLWSSSTGRFRDSLLSTLDPSPSLVKTNLKGDIEDQLMEKGSYDLLEAYFLLKRFSHLFAGLVLSIYEIRKGCKILEDKSPKEVFDLVSIELSFMYDLLYTKAIIVYTRLGFFLRCLIFLSSISALVVFSIVIDINAYPLTDIYITYILLVGAVVLEVYAFISHFFSDWTKLICFIKSENPKNNICGATVPCQSILSKHKRWSESMGQFNLINFCLKADISIIFKCITGVLNLVGLCKLFEKYLDLTSEDVKLDLQEIIFKAIEDTRLEEHDYYNHILDSAGKSILARRGDHVLEKKYNIDLPEQNWCTVNCDFDESLLIWHIATDLCYHQDLERHGESLDHLHPKCKISRCLSNYMLYLLIFCPSMMPKGIGELRYRDTCHEAMRLFKLRRNVTKKTKNEACKLLFERKASIKPAEDEKLSVLESVMILVKNLQSLESKDNWSCQKKWEMISEVWVEMLAYAANSCGWKEHGQQLGKGGELLTHVCLLMAHTGASAQYDIVGKHPCFHEVLSELY